MKSGILDRRITVQVLTITRDAANDEIRTWADLTRRWASKAELGGSEVDAAGQALREGAAQFTLRWDSESLTFFPESHRFIWQERIYEIVAMNEQASNRHDGVAFICAFRPDGIGSRGPIGDGGTR